MWSQGARNAPRCLQGQRNHSVPHTTQDTFEVVVLVAQSVLAVSRPQRMFDRGSSAGCLIIALPTDSEPPSEREFLLL